jgi:nucleotide-binding universal stress UspA family protein
MAITDFSSTASAGIDWAGRIARTHRARLVLFHAFMPPVPPSLAPQYAPLPPSLHEQLRAAALARLEESAERIRGEGLEVSTSIEIGPAVDAVMEAAEKEAADLVVMGTRGLTGWRHLLLGSTAERVIQRLTCPVLTVHPSDASQHRPVRTVLVPTDFSPFADLAAHAAVRLLGPQGSEARVILLHAYHIPAEFGALGMGSVSPSLLADLEQQARTAIEESAGRLRAGGLQVETEIVEGYPPAVIEAEARRTDADLIAIGTRGRSGLAHLFLGSTAERVVQHAPCPVLTVHRGED